MDIPLVGFRFGGIGVSAFLLMINQELIKKSTCPDCNGTGTDPDPELAHCNCDECSGTGTIKTYPDTYLYVRESRSGEEWILPIKGTWSMDLKTRVKHWIQQEFHDELQQCALDGELQQCPTLEGDFWAEIKTDGRAPDSNICWESGGFWLKSTIQ